LFALGEYIVAHDEYIFSDGEYKIATGEQSFIHWIEKKRLKVS